MRAVAQGGGGLGVPGRASVQSADRHFRVSGLSSAENLVWAEKLSDLARWVEEWTGHPLPFDREQIISVSFRSQSSAAAQVLRVQGWEEGRFYQRLVAPGAWGVDAEDFSEAACWLLLNRYAAATTPPLLRLGMGAESPDWLAYGLAQNAQSVLSSRNREWIAREWSAGRAMALADVIKLEHLPAGRWREKAYAAAAVEFLFPDESPEVWQEIFQALGGREPLDARWLQRHSPALAGQNPEAAWRAWLIRFSSVNRLAGQKDRGFRQEMLLLDILNFRPRELAVDVPEDIPDELFASDLTDYRGQTWCLQLASALRMRVQDLGPGAPPSLREVLTAYSAYFAQLTRPPRPKLHWWQRSIAEDTSASPPPPDDAAWALALHQLWQRAERLHQQFLETAQSRKQYVDEWDLQTMDAETLRHDHVLGDAEGARTPLQRYVDRFE